MERSTSAFEPDRALELVEGDSDLLASAARSFLRQNTTRMDELREAVHQGDAERVERIAHSLCGAASNFAAAHAEQCARALEEAAAQRDTAAWASLLEALESALSELADALSTYCARHELRHVLLVEDDDVTRRRLEALLRKWDYRVTAVTRGDVALELLGDGPPYLAVVDWMLPGVDGLGICRALRARKNDHYVYVLLITAKDHPDAMLTGLDAGADDFLVKPVRPAELRVRLRAGERIVELQERLIARMDEQRRQSDRDGLTGLHSPRRIRELLEEQLERHLAGDTPLSIALLDIDGLRQINENHGHAVGDTVLRAACLRLQAGLRDLDLFGRFGGDEFLAVLPRATLAEARAVVETMTGALSSTPIECGDFALSLGASAGVAEADGDTADVEALLKAADRALSEAKRRS